MRYRLLLLPLLAVDHSPAPTPSTTLTRATTHPVFPHRATTIGLRRLPITVGPGVRHPTPTHRLTTTLHLSLVPQTAERPSISINALADQHKFSDFGEEAMLMADLPGYTDYTSTLSRSYCRVQPLQLNAGVGGGELPTRFGVVLVPGGFPGGDFIDQVLLVWDTPIETLR